VATEETLQAVFEASDGPALITEAPSDPWGFGQLESRVDGLARRLRTVGIDRGDNIGIVLPAGPVFVQTLLAVTALGAAAAPLNPAYTTSEFRFYLDDLRPRLLLAPTGLLGAAREAAATLSLQVVEIGGAHHDGVRPVVDGHTIEAQSPFEGAAPDDVALVLHTSGTTSGPKQVALLHRNVMASVRAIVRHYGLGPADVSFCAMPLFHVHGMIASVLAPLAGGGCVVLPSRLSGRTFWRGVADQRATWYSASPTVHQKMLDHESGTRHPAPDLRFVRSCSAPLSSTLHQRLEARFGVPVVEAYGMTEASHQIASNPLDAPKAGSVGLPTGTRIKVIGSHGRPVMAGETGEVLVRGPGVTPGYVNNSEANRDAFVDGWFRTGDLGGIDDEGYLELRGRIKELIIRGGENISPHEIEEVLVSHDAVQDVVCFGVPDDKYGEVVEAAVVLIGSAAQPDLREFARSRLAAFKVPTTIHVLDEIPRTATGKPQRQRMPALLGRETNH